MLAVTTVSVGTVAWVYKNRKEDATEKTVVLNGNAQEEMSVKLTDIYPGYTTSYQIRLKGEKDKSYSVTVSFEEAGEVTMAPFVDVSVNYGGKTVGGGKLSELLEGKEATLQADFSSSTTQEVEIVYSMSEEVGDEAQNTVADFEVVLTER